MQSFAFLAVEFKPFRLIFFRLGNPLSSMRTATIPTTMISSRGVIVLWVAAVAICLINALLAENFSRWKDANFMMAWIVAHMLPMPQVRGELLETAWSHWEELYGSRQGLQGDLHTSIPTVDVQDHKDNLLDFLETNYGANWRRKPLLMKNLWTVQELDNAERRLSVRGLMHESLTIPYFTDARRDDALSPDSKASVGEIVSNITEGQPHKIGTQFLVQKYPELVTEIAPTSLVTELFGEFFTPDSIRGTGPGLLLPALTTVPVFVAGGGATLHQPADGQSRPYTALHCEPIGNVAVQLSGVKEWILVDPKYYFLIRPSLAPDGRAFFASWKSIQDMQVPYYSATTAAGDALWVPTWTWHRVDYTPSDDIAIGGSLFHFRPKDFLVNNPLFAVMAIPAMLKELLGMSSQ